MSLRAHPAARAVLVACALLIPTVAAEPARAQPAEAAEAEEDASTTREANEEEIKLARQTAIDGLTAYKAGEYDKALGLFESARALYPSAQILRMTGYSHLALLHWMKAAEALEEALESQLGPLEEDDRKDVEEQLKKARAHLGTVTITSSVEGAELFVDIEPPRPLPLEKPLRMLEGRHHFVVTAPEHNKAEQTVKIEGGKAIELKLDPTPIEVAPPPPPPPKPAPPPPPPKPWTGFFPYQREIGLAAAGTGLALGGVALITGLVGADLRGNVEEDVALHTQHFGSSCERGDYRLCVYDRAIINNDADRADTLRDVSLWTGIGSAVLFAGGATLFLMAPGSPLALGPSPKGDAASLACGPLAAGLACKGSF